MSDYTKATDFGAKDALSSGNPSKTIVGEEIDDEFDAIAVAVATKYDSTDLASQAQAEAGSDNATLMTPLRVAQAITALESNTLSGLTDTTITGPASNDVLQWSGTAWVDRSFSEAGLAPVASPTFTGTVTIATVDCNGGAIDGTTIGGTTPAAGTFTTVTATTYSGLPTASTTVEGVVERATQTEVDTGTDTTRYVTPSTLANYSGLGAGTITALGDTTITGPASNDVLQWNGSAWVDRSLSEAGIAPIASPTFTGTVSGDGSGLTSVNAATLDSIDSTSFLRSDAADQKTSGDLRFNDSVQCNFGTGNDAEVYCNGTNFYLDLNSSGVASFIIRDGVTTRFTFARGTGDFTATGDVTAYSDLALKKNLATIDDAVNKVYELTGYTYTRKDTGARQTGLIAQEVQKVLPEAVSQLPDGTLTLAYGNLVGLLVNAIKELTDRIDRLEDKYGITS